MALSIALMLLGACSRGRRPVRQCRASRCRCWVRAARSPMTAARRPAYLVWVDGNRRVLIDAGGGTFLRFGEAGASFADLDFVGLSHLHTDHSADFPALLKSGNFSRARARWYWPARTGQGAFPGSKAGSSAMLASRFRRLCLPRGFLDGTAGCPCSMPREVAPAAGCGCSHDDDMRVEAMHVPHGIVPAVAFRVTIGEQVIVFASDQNGSDPAFVEFAKDASLLVMHLVVPEDISGVGRRLHAPPSVVGWRSRRAPKSGRWC